MNRYDYTALAMLFITIVCARNASATSGTYIISFMPEIWICGQTVTVTFTGPLVESGRGGDQIEFDYYQYSPTNQSHAFTDYERALTSDTITYQIDASEWGSLTFYYMNHLYVTVTDTTDSNRTKLLAEDTGTEPMTCNLPPPVQQIGRAHV